ncbi:hypothetical protein BN946_scf184533.g3 [Trametes cinnabarina]|uniref:Uncharacterized protein n=1 Tax=Pycnoporus cinnabarinus TaxID=5643 RepID=A0A060STW3_PYCCI|nr:hypothetical protein BN946_scf184533.g3 [Trametes cinnabarina]
MSATIKTELTELLRIRVPIVSASMVEVSRAGGFGFFGVAGFTREKLRDELSYARTHTSDLQDKPLPIGCGFLGWMLELKEDEYRPLLDIVIEAGVRAIWLSFGNNLDRWIQYIRNATANIPSVRKPLLFVQVTTVEEALRAANEWKVDVIVAQGNESGGHGRSTAPSTMVLLSEILAALPRDSIPPVLAAGGISNGAQIAAYLTAGASGAVLGTRFVLTPESTYSDAQKNVLKAAKSSQTVRSLAFDQARGTNNWPDGIDGRGIRNGIVRDIESGVDEETTQEKYRAAVQAGDTNYMVIWSGQGISLINDIKPARAVVEELSAGAVQALRRAQRLLA